jgi:hypothetical protein
VSLSNSETGERAHAKSPLETNVLCQIPEITNLETEKIALGSLFWRFPSRNGWSGCFGAHNAAAHHGGSVWDCKTISLHGQDVKKRKRKRPRPHNLF